MYDLDRALDDLKLTVPLLVERHNVIPGMIVVSLPALPASPTWQPNPTAAPSSFVDVHEGQTHWSEYRI